MAYGEEAAPGATTKPDADIAFFVIGTTPAHVAGATFSSRPRRCDAVLLTRSVEAAEFAALVDKLDDPALPVADFADNRHLHRDFFATRFDSRNLEAIRSSFASIWQRLREVPFRAVYEDRHELAVLRLAFSRKVAIEARYAPDQHLAVYWPLVGSGIAVRNQLEFLAGAELLRRRHFTRTHACGNCGSARLNAFEACPACGSADLADETLIHHYRCGWQAPESQFAQGQLLICPKCRRELRHLGVDYGRPGTLVVCHNCNAANAEPEVRFACLECSEITPGSAAARTDWYHYDLTEHAIEALRQGRLPRLDIGRLLNGKPRALSLQEFRLLTKEGIRVAQRYQRPFAVARLSISNVDALRGELGPVRLGDAFYSFIDAIVANLRISDFVTADGTSSVLLGFPETSSADVSSVIARIRTRVKDRVPEGFDFAATVAEGDSIDDLVEGT